MMYLLIITTIILSFIIGITVPWYIEILYALGMGFGFYILHKFGVFEED